MRADEQTIASILKPLGYATGGFGKWGCGGRDSTGVPEKQGFDTFLGYYDQVHAHTYYPPYLIRNSEEVKLEGNNGGSEGKTYSQYVIHDAAVKFIRENGSAKKPFFAYLPYTPPHGNFDIPDSDPAWALYKDKPWTEDARRYAAMVTMVDRQVGEILALLKELGIDENTLVFFSGDNGGNDYFKSVAAPARNPFREQEPEDRRRVSRHQRHAVRGRSADSVHRALARQNRAGPCQRLSRLLSRCAAHDGRSHRGQGAG